MATGTNNKPPALFQRWAREQLDLRPGMADGDVRRAVLRQLSEMDFMPSPGWDSALRVAGVAACDDNLDGPVHGPARRGAEELLRDEVDEFAQQFFSLPPTVRQARFEAIAKQCAAMPAIAARLEGLRPALGWPCDLPANLSPEAAQLLGQARGLFVLRRQERADRRFAFLHNCQADREKWQRVATVMQANIARVTLLEPELFRELSTWGDRDKRRAKIARQRKRAMRKAHPPKMLTRASQSRSLRLIALVVVVVGARLFLLSKNHSRQPSPKPFVDKFDVESFNREMNERVTEAIRSGQPVSDSIRRLHGLPPQTAPSPSQNQPPSSLPAQEAEVHVANMQQALEILRLLQERQARELPNHRYELRFVNLEQARDMLRELREQQQQAGHSDARDAVIKGLEKIVDEASRQPRKTP